MESWRSTKISFFNTSRKKLKVGRTDREEIERERESRTSQEPFVTFRPLIFSYLRYIIPHHSSCKSLTYSLKSREERLVTGAQNCLCLRSEPEVPSSTLPFCVSFLFSSRFINGYMEREFERKKERKRGQEMLQEIRFSLTDQWELIQGTLNRLWLESTRVKSYFVMRRERKRIQNVWQIGRERTICPELQHERNVRKAVQEPIPSRSLAVRGKNRIIGGTSLRGTSLFWTE